MESRNNSFSVEKPEDSTGFLLWQVTNLWQREIRKVLEPYDITHSQFVLLTSIHWLSIHEQEVTQILLSNHTKIDPMTTSTVLRTLQSKKFIKRQEHPTDSRAKTVALTDKGLKTAKQAVTAVEKFDKDFFSKLKPSLAAFNKNLLTLLNE